MLIDTCFASLQHRSEVYLYWFIWLCCIYFWHSMLYIICFCSIEFRSSSFDCPAFADARLWMLYDDIFRYLENKLEKLNITMQLWGTAAGILFIRRWSLLRGMALLLDGSFRILIRIVYWPQRELGGDTLVEYWYEAKFGLPNFSMHGTWRSPTACCLSRLSVLSIKRRVDKSNKWGNLGILCSYIRTLRRYGRKACFVGETRNYHDVIIPKSEYFSCSLFMCKFNFMPCWCLVKAFACLAFSPR